MNPMNAFRALLVLVVFATCLMPLRASADDALIVPGKSIGQTKIHETDPQLRARLGKPSAEDMAMVRELCSWTDAKAGTRLDVLLCRN